MRFEISVQIFVFLHSLITRSALICGSCEINLCLWISISLQRDQPADPFLKGKLLLVKLKVVFNQIREKVNKFETNLLFLFWKNRYTIRLHSPVNFSFFLRSGHFDFSGKKSTEKSDRSASGSDSVLRRARLLLVFCGGESRREIEKERVGKGDISRWEHVRE